MITKSVIRQLLITLLATGLPSTADSDPDTSHAVYKAAAAAFLAFADALDALPATLDDFPEDYRPVVTYQAAKARADARAIAQVLDDLVAARGAVDKAVYADEAVYETASDAEIATVFVVCDIAAALAGAHARRQDRAEQ